MHLAASHSFGGGAAAERGCGGAKRAPGRPAQWRTVGGCEAKETLPPPARPKNACARPAGARLFKALRLVSGLVVGCCGPQPRGPRHGQLQGRPAALGDAELRAARGLLFRGRVSLGEQGSGLVNSQVWQGRKQSAPRSVQGRPSRARLDVDRPPVAAEAVGYGVDALDQRLDLWKGRGARRSGAVVPVPGFRV